MKGSLLILSVFLIGVITGISRIIPIVEYLDDASIFILYGLMFLVGVSLGMDHHVWHQIRIMNIKVLLVPLSTFIGTFAGIYLYQFLFVFPKGKDLFAIGAGFGYYSFSSIFINKISGEKMGIIALLANIIREVLTLILAPVLVKFFGKLAPISSGGATTSDTTLPIILKYSGKDYVLCSVINGILLTLAVPFILSLIYQL